MAAPFQREVSAERHGNRIIVDYQYSRELVAAMQSIPGRSYRKRGKNWSVPLDLTTCRLLRKAFDPDRTGYPAKLIVGPELKAWAKNAIREEESLGKIALADTAELNHLPKTDMRLADAIHVGPKGRFMTPAEFAKALTEDGSYQTADVRFLVDSVAPVNANQQGLGKTPEWIAAIIEGGMYEGDHLIIAPSAAVDGTWEPELEEWLADAPFTWEIFACTGKRAQREAILAAWEESEAEARFIVVNPQMIQYRKTAERTPIARKAKPKEIKAGQACHCSRLKDGHHHYEATYPELFRWRYKTIAIDECHKGNIRNHRSLTSFSIHDLNLMEDGKKTAMSGTPMKKMGADIWGLLNWLRPDVFTSYWRFAEMFFEIIDNGYGKKVGRLREDREDEFFQYLTPYVVRRTKAECLPWLPPKQFIEVPVRLEGKQATQYAQMEADGVAALADGSRVETTSILAEFTRLSQFANAYCDVRNGKVVPTRESAKLTALFQKLDETGIFDGDNEEQTVIFSQSREMIELVATMLREKGVAIDVIRGGQSRQGQRRQIKEAFQVGHTKVLCIVTTAGGVSLTLDAADSAHFIDQSWAPDDDEQAEDRLHRASRIHNVRIYQYIALETIDEVRGATAIEKDTAHKYILDVRRELLRARGKQTS